MRWLTTNASLSGSTQEQEALQQLQKQMHLWMHLSICTWPFPFCIYYSIIMDSHFAYKMLCSAVTFHYVRLLTSVVLVAESHCPCHKNSWGFRAAYKELFKPIFEYMLQHYSLSKVRLEQRKFGLLLSKWPSSVYGTLQRNWKALNIMVHSHHHRTMYWFTGTLTSCSKGLSGNTLSYYNPMEVIHHSHSPCFNVFLLGTYITHSSRLLLVFPLCHPAFIQQFKVPSAPLCQGLEAVAFIYIFHC